MAVVLVVDDELNFRNALGELLKSWGHVPVLASSFEDAVAKLDQPGIEVAFVDVLLPDGSGIDLVQHVRERGARIPIILLTGHGSVEEAVKAIQLGAEDYLTKPVDPPRLKLTVEKMLEKVATEEEVHSLRQQLRKAGTVGSLIGRSAPMQNLYSLIERVAPTDAAVFITGESGSGKSLIGKTIHDYSRRRKKSFVGVNCAAIAPTLIESELFGHEKGAFTGATQQRRGYFEEANGGTIFLDEITELPIELQGKLLRVLEENRIRRVGGNQEIETHVRFISATNRDPKTAIADGKLREDLYYRINLFPIHAPTLRERPEDIPFLAGLYLEKLCEEEGHVPVLFDSRVLEILKSYQWPGNVRELRNVVNRALIVSRGNRITVDALPDYLKVGLDLAQMAAEFQDEAQKEPEIDALALPETRQEIQERQNHMPPIDLDGEMTLESMEEMMIKRLLAGTENNKPLVAEKLGISLKTLYNKIKKYEI